LHHPRWSGSLLQRPPWADYRPRYWPLGDVRAVGRQPATSVPAPRSRSMMTKRVIQAKSNQTMLALLAAIGIVGLLVARRHGVQHVLRTVNQALGIARVVRTARPSTARPTRRRPARRVRPKVMGFSKPR
jgi:hypothetical protein